MLVEKNTLGQLPFCNSALISVPGASAPSLTTLSQPAVEKPGVEIWAPPCVAVALVRTFQPAVPRLTTALDPVGAAEPDTEPAADGPALAGPSKPPACIASVATPSATEAAKSFLLLIGHYAPSRDGGAARVVDLGDAKPSTAPDRVRDWHAPRSGDRRPFTRAGPVIRKAN